MHSQGPQCCSFCLSPQSDVRRKESLDGTSKSKIDPLSKSKTDPSAILEICTLKLFRAYSVNSLEIYSHIQGLEQA